MTKPKIKVFYSTSDIKTSGDNQENIFCPSGLIHTGEDFKIYANDTVMIVPFQPDNKGPWQSYRTSLYNYRLVKNKVPTSLCFLLTNRWIWKTILVTRGCRLDWLLAHPGIHHAMGTLTAQDMATINFINKDSIHPIKEEDYDDDDNDENSDSLPPPSPPSETQPNLPTPRLVTSTCPQCCHNVEIIRQ
jgi:hypothetical protein